MEEKNNEALKMKSGQEVWKPKPEDMAFAIQLEKGKPPAMEIKFSGKFYIHGKETESTQKIQKIFSEFCRKNTEGFKKHLILTERLRVLEKRLQEIPVCLRDEPKQWVKGFEACQGCLEIDLGEAIDETKKALEDLDKN